MRFRVDRSAQAIGSQMTIAPPTIAGLQAQGVVGAWVTCGNQICSKLIPDRMTT